MELNKYRVFFDDKEYEEVRAKRMVDAVIYCQREQIRFNRSVKPVKVYEYATPTSRNYKVYKPNWFFSATEIVENKHPQLLKEGV